MFKRYLVVLLAVMACAVFVYGQTSWPTTVITPRVVKAWNYGDAPLVSNLYTVAQADIDSLHSDMSITVNVTAVNDSNNINLGITYQDLTTNRTVSETRTAYNASNELQLPMDTLNFGTYKIRPRIIRILFYNTKRQVTNMRYVARIVPSDTLRVRVTNDSLSTY